MRAQPFHLGHELIIKKMLGECERAVVMLGCLAIDKGISNHENPISFYDRLRMITNVFEKDMDAGRLLISFVNDIGNRKLWAGYVLAKMWQTFGIEANAYYCGQGQDASLFKAAGLDVKEISRVDLPICATKIREGVHAGDLSVLMHVNKANRQLVQEVLTKNIRG